MSGGSSGDEGSSEGHYWDKRNSCEYPGRSWRDDEEGSGVGIGGEERWWCWEGVGGRGDGEYEVDTV